MRVGDDLTLNWISTEDFRFAAVEVCCGAVSGGVFL